MNDNTTQTISRSGGDDRGLGLAMLVIFIAAALTVTGAVAMLALIDSWWLLGLAFGVHLLITAAVAPVSFIAVRHGSTTAPAKRGGVTTAPDGPAPVTGALLEAGRAYPAAA